MEDKKENAKNKEEKNIEKLKKELKEELKKEMLEEILIETKKEHKNKKQESKFEEETKKIIDKIMDTEDNTKDYDEKDIDDNKFMGIISYLGPLCLVPYFVSKNSKFAKYHAIQGLNLFIIELIISACSRFLEIFVQVPKICELWGEVNYQCGTVTPWWIDLPVGVVEIFTFVIAIIGIINAAQGKVKELPIISKVKIVK